MMVDQIYKTIIDQYDKLVFNYDILSHYYKNNFQFIVGDKARIFKNLKQRE